jgi:hypothetical protein
LLARVFLLLSAFSPSIAGQPLLGELTMFTLPSAIKFEADALHF